MTEAKQEAKETKAVKTTEAKAAKPEKVTEVKAVKSEKMTDVKDTKAKNIATKAIQEEKDEKAGKGRK